MQTPARQLRLPSARATFAAVALAGIAAICLATVLASARGQSFMSPTLHRDPPSWLTWPFGGLWRPVALPHVQLQYELVGALVALHACWALAIAYARRLPKRAVWAAVAFVYVVFFLSSPLLLTDVFNYVGYARMGALHHLNPYTALPVDIASDPVSRLSNWHHLPSPYGPLFTLINYPLVVLGIAGHYWAYKALVLAASLGSLALVARIARQLGREPRTAVVVTGLNPLVLIYGAAGQHNDMLLMALVLGAVTLALDGRGGRSAFAMAAAVAMKASAALFLPIMVAGARDRRRALAGAVAGLVVFGATALIAFGPHLPAIATQAKLVTVWSIPNIGGFVAGHGGEDAAVRSVMQALLALATVACTAYAWRSRDVVRPLAWLTVAVIATLGWDMPWYLLWLLPFIVFVPGRAFRIAAIAVCAWITIQWLPFEATVAHQLGFTPHKSAVWGVNERYLNSLLK